MFRAFLLDINWETCWKCASNQQLCLYGSLNLKSNRWSLECFLLLFFNLLLSFFVFILLWILNLPKSWLEASVGRLTSSCYHCCALHWQRVTTNGSSHAFSHPHFLSISQNCTICHFVKNVHFRKTAEPHHVLNKVLQKPLFLVWNVRRVHR